MTAARISGHWTDFVVSGDDRSREGDKSRDMGVSQIKVGIAEPRSGAQDSRDEILKVWYQNTSSWRSGRAETIVSADFTCGVCGESVTGLAAWNRHRGLCYTKDAEFSEAERLARSERMRERNPMKDPEVARRALATSRARYLTDPSHGWHRNLERLEMWRHRHPSGGQVRLYAVLDSMGVSYEKEYRIELDNRFPNSRKFYVADAAVPEMKIDIEIDGFWHVKSEKVRESDRVRDATLESNGWRVVRIWSQDLFRHEAAVRDLIDEAIAPVLRTNKKMWLPVHSASRTDRICKYNQLLRIEEELGKSARYGLSASKMPAGRRG